MAETRGADAPSLPFPHHIGPVRDSIPPAACRVHLRLVIASSVRLVREGLAASLHGREGVAVVDAISLDPAGVARIARAQPEVVLVDLGQTQPIPAARLIRSVSPDAKLVAFALDENLHHRFLKRDNRQFSPFNGELVRLDDDGAPVFSAEITPRDNVLVDRHANRQILDLAGKIHAGLCGDGGCA